MCHFNMNWSQVSLLLSPLLIAVCKGMAIPYYDPETTYHSHPESSPNQIKTVPQEQSKSSSDNALSPELKRWLVAFMMQKNFEESGIVPPMSTSIFHNDDIDPKLERLLVSYQMLKDLEGVKVPVDADEAKRRTADQKTPNDINDNGEKLEIDDNRRTLRLLLPAAELAIKLFDAVLGLGFNIFKDLQNVELSADSAWSQRRTADQKTPDDVNHGGNNLEIDDILINNRRTFQLLLPAAELALQVIDADLGLGLTETIDSSMQDHSKTLKISQEKVSQESQLQLELERAKAASSLEKIKSESNLVAKNNLIELDTIKSKLNQVAEQTERERREKLELQMKLENMETLREREREELKRKLDYEARIRELEEMNFQVQMEQELSRHDRQEWELKNKLEMELILEQLKKMKQEEEARHEMFKTTNKLNFEYRVPLNSPAIGVPTVSFL